MSKRFHDWYDIQKKMQGWEAIPSDLAVVEKLMPLDITINFDYCHYGLRNLLQDFECPAGDQPDFFIITDLELGKRNLEDLFVLYREYYEKSKAGIYVAALSYYLQTTKTYDNLTGSYSENIDTVFRSNLNFANKVENYSTVMDYPVDAAQLCGTMIEGSNYIFVHPNVKYFLWK
jgi:hypothetical protein